MTRQSILICVHLCPSVVSILYLIRECRDSGSQNQHRIAVAEKAVTLRDGFAVGREHKITPARFARRGEAAVTLECADLSALSAGDLSPSNAGRRPALPGR